MCMHYVLLNSEQLAKTYLWNLLSLRAFIGRGAPPDMKLDPDLFKFFRSRKNYFNYINTGPK